MRRLTKTALLLLLSLLLLVRNIGLKDLRKAK